MQTYHVELKRSAKKEFDALELSVQGRLLDAFRFLSLNPFSEILHIKKLKGAPGLYRLRVGDYRIIYEVDRDTVIITIIKIGHRREVYR
jgi:mRNA interferase RelE/StbE